jgi:hypothetical protein
MYTYKRWNHGQDKQTRWSCFWERIGMEGNMQVYLQYKVFFILKNSQSCCSIMAVLGGDLEKVH